MKNLKKLFLVPVLALGTLSSCYGKNDTTCPEEKKCEACPTPSSPTESGTGVSKDGHTLSVDAKEIKVLVDEEIGKVKHIVATASPSTDTLSYSSSDTSVAEVSSSGVITGKKANAYCVVTVKSSAGLQLDIAVKTYSVSTYFKYYRDGSIVGIVDRDVEELEFPQKNPFNGANITSISRRFALNLEENAFNRFSSSPLKNVKKIIVPEGYTTIEEYVFAAKAEKCETLVLPSTLTSFQSSSIAGLKNLKDITFSEGEGTTAFTVSTSEENGAKVLYNTNNKTAYKVFNYPGNGSIFDQGLGLTEIAPYTCYNMDTLTDLVIPEGVTNCQARSIYFNKNLKSITFSSTVNKISDTNKNFCAIANENLEAIHFPEGVDFIDTNYTNKNANGEEANCVVWAKDSNNSSARSLACATKNMNWDDSFLAPEGTTASKISTFEYSANVNVGYSGIVKFPETMVEIRQTFGFNKNLKGVYIPKSVTTIDTNGIPQVSQYRLEATTYGNVFLNMVYDDGVLPFYPINYIYSSESYFSPFIFENEDFTIYYQTRDDGLSLIEKFGASLGYSNHAIKFKEVADSSLAEPTPVEEENGN